jgi:hypothetical protein
MPQSLALPHTSKSTMSLEIEVIPMNKPLALHPNPLLALH